jgi:hypothetical protein
MRLLKYKENGELDIVSFDDDTTPPYAILSHTWGGDAEEVTFADIVSGNGKIKHGYNKICFCGKQAQQDNLQYFWVDTCCIDKTDKAELSHAIQSMFRWYQNATRCYVYLSDVSARKRKYSDVNTEYTWEPAFRSSRWFTRGWTLQELVAPSTVEFFSQEWDKLGDKTSLNTLIHRTTGISQEVLDGAPLSQFSINERLRWKEGRETKREEDGAYSLLGIFHVELAPVYGEGAAAAFKRLMNEIHTLERCIQDIRSTDPRDDKKRIEETKGGLLADSYRWVLNNATFQQWKQNKHSQLLWVRGDPGKGKTMLLCGIVDELHGLLRHTAFIAYFFCQATDSRINSATAVLRGLLYMLVTQQPMLVSHVRKKYDRAGKNLFEDANAWTALTEIVVDVLQDPRLNPTYLIIDALDECVTDLPKLLKFVAKQSSASCRVKWVVSSRNWPDIGEQLDQAGHKVSLSLELNAESISAGVSVFIQHKVSQLAQQKNYDKEVQGMVVERLMSNANDTYLWVSLVCQDLQATARRNVLKKLDSFPPGLNALYEQMMQQIGKTDDAELCKQMLASLALVYRPVTLGELVALVGQLDDITDISELKEIVGLCGSFLTLRNQTVYFVHQSAKDFLLAQAAEELFPSGKEQVHHVILNRALEIMSATLRRDMYGLKNLGYTARGEIEAPDPDPLAASRYSCIHWIDHLCDLDLISSTICVEYLKDRGVVDSFLQKKFLYWLEALSLCKSMSKGVASIGKLQKLIQVC